MRNVPICLVAICFACLIGGCSLMPAKTYDGSGAYGDAHPDQAQPMPYMDPSHQYSADDK